MPHAPGRAPHPRGQVREQPLAAFDRAKLVYLSANGEELLTELKADEVYVIGGIVDRNRLKNCTYQKAQDLGIRCARLPLQEHMDPEKMRKSTPHLTVPRKPGHP